MSGPCAGRRHTYEVIILAIACAIGGLSLVRQPVAFAGDTAPQAKWCVQTPGHDCMEDGCGSGKRTIVFFTADWCGWCLQLKAKIFPDPMVQKLLSRFFLIEVDIDENEALAKKFKISVVPGWLIIERACKRRIDQFKGAPSTVEVFIERFKPYL